MVHYSSFDSATNPASADASDLRGFEIIDIDLYIFLFYIVENFDTLDKAWPLNSWSLLLLLLFLL